MRHSKITHVLLVLFLSLTMTMLPMISGTVYAASEGSTTEEEQLSTAEDVLNMEQKLPNELDPESQSYNEALAEGDLYGADTTHNLQGEHNGDTNNPNTPFMLSTQNELALFAADNSSTTLYQMDNFDLEQTKLESNGLRWVNGINVANAESSNSLTSDNAVAIFKELYFPQSIAFDRDGNGRNDYIATVGRYNNYVMLVIQNAAGGSYTTIQIEAATWMNGQADWLMDNYFAITAGDYDGDGKDSIIVYVCGDGDNVKLKEYTYSGGQWTGKDILKLSSVLKDTTFTSSTDMKYKPVVSLTTGDFDGDGGESFAYSAGYYNTSGSVADGYTNYETNDLEQFATCVGVYEKATGSWSSSSPIWMYERAQTYQTFENNQYTYELTFIHAGVVAAGDVNNDGIDEIVVAGYTDHRYEDHNTRYARGVYDKKGNLLKVGDIYNYIDSFAVSVISKNNGNFKKSTIQKFGMSQAQGYTFKKYCNDQDYEFVKVCAVCGNTNGNNYGADVFISGIIYGASNNSVSLSAKYQPNIVCSNDLSDTTGKIKHESSVNWIRNVAAGNFNGNNAGREQFVFTLWQKTKSKNYYTSNIGVITGVEYQDTFVKDDEGNDTDAIESYGEPLGYACNLNAYDITNSCIKINEENKKAATQFNVESDAAKGKPIFFVPVAVDIDDDGLQGRFRSSGYVYTDPDVVAVLEGGPYYSEIDEIGGYSDPCGTTYSFSTGYESGTTSSDNVSFEVGFALEAECPGVKESLELGYCMDYTHSFENSYSVETTYSYSADYEDIVVMTRVPHLIYTYDVWDAANNKWIINGYSVRVPLSPVYSMLSVDEYNEFVTDYNKIVDSQYELNEIVYGTDLPEDHVGVPDNYWADWKDAGNGYKQLCANSTQLGYSSGAAEVEISSTNASTEATEISHGFHFGYTYQTGADLVVVEAWGGVYVNLDYSHSDGSFTTKTNTNACSGKVQNIYLNDIKIDGLTSAQKTALIKKYGFSWTFGKWTRQLSTGGPEIPFYGYVVTDARRPALPPDIGAQSTTIAEGYSAFSVGDYTSGLSSDLTVKKKDGDAKITYDASSKSIRVAAGLEPGTYPATFTITNLIPPCDKEFTFTVTVTQDFTKNWTGSGSEYDPYVISNTAGWNDLADFVAAGVNTEGVHFALGDDISVTEMVGVDRSTKRFCGTFDGDGHTLTFNANTTKQYCGPFAYTYNAAFLNLHTAGTIRTNQKFAAGLAARADGTTTVTNCRSSIVIDSAVNGDGTHGGFIAAGDVTFDGCVFDGKLLGTDTTLCAGFLGWANSACSFTNCVFDPEDVTLKSNNANFSRHLFNGTNCYYTQTMDYGGGKQAHTISADEGISIRFGEGTEYDVSGITAHAAGLEYNGIFFAGEGDQVSLTMPDPSGRLKEYAVSEGVLAGDGTDYVLEMPDNDVHIFMMDADDPSVNDVTEEIDRLGEVTNELAELQYQLTNGGLSEDELNEVNINLYRIEERLEGVRRDVSTLTDVQQGLLSEDQLAALAAAEQQLGEVMTIADSVGKTEDEIAEMQFENQFKADEVINMISWLPDPAGLDPADETGYEIAMEQIRAAEDAYESLKPQEKALVSNINSLIATAQAARQKWNSYTPVEEFTVTFVDGQGNTLKEETVEKGKAATAPADPTREGYTFSGWNKDFSNITSDLTVTARWKKNTTPPAPQEPVSIKDAQVVLSKTAFTYNAKVQKPAIKTIKGFTLKEGTDYTAVWSNDSSKNAGTYTVTITGKGDYTGTTKATYTISKAANPMTLKAKTASVKYSNLKKKTQTLAATGVIDFTKDAKDKKTYTLSSAKKGKKSFKKYFKINKSTGKVTVKKGLKKGTYKVTVKVKALGNANYKASAVKTVTFTVRVK